MISWEAMTNNLAPPLLLILQCGSIYVAIVAGFWIATWVYLKMREVFGRDDDEDNEDNEDTYRPRQLNRDHTRPTSWDEMRERLRRGR